MIECIDDIPATPVSVTEWLIDHFSGRMPQARWIALADVMCHSNKGNIQGWRYEVSWEKSGNRLVIKFHS
jgi:hypothetical protein